MLVPIVATTMLLSPPSGGSRHLGVRPDVAGVLLHALDERMSRNTRTLEEVQVW